MALALSILALAHFLHHSHRHCWHVMGPTPWAFSHPNWSEDSQYEVVGHGSWTWGREAQRTRNWREHCMSGMRGRALVNQTKESFVWILYSWNLRVVCCFFFFFFMISQCFGRALGPSAPLKESPVAVGCDFLWEQTVAVAEISITSTMFHKDAHTSAGI